MFRVESTDAQRPLSGEVTVHLHPTYKRWMEYKLDVVDGIAKDEFDALGTFTIGIEADGGATKLEVDLADVKGGTKKFYEQ